MGPDRKEELPKEATKKKEETAPEAPQLKLLQVKPQLNNQLSQKLPQPKPLQLKPQQQKQPVVTVKPVANEENFSLCLTQRRKITKRQFLPVCDQSRDVWSFL